MNLFSNRREMIGRAGGSPDRSFYCLLGIYAVHAALFHVFCVAPDTGSTNNFMNVDQSSNNKGYPNNEVMRFKYKPMMMMMNSTDNHNDTAFHKHDQALSLDKRDIFTTMPLSHDVSLEPIILVSSLFFFLFSFFFFFTFSKMQIFFLLAMRLYNF